MTPLKTLDLKLLTGLNIILPSYLSRNNDLALGGNGGSHESKISSYQGVVNRGQEATDYILAAVVD
ncbi:MAG: hypothetical protein LC794_02590 [Acidobacteria bacterium]|nr:hypothetical protein [Acidobacteriota bacterium]